MVALSLTYPYCFSYYRPPIYIVLSPTHRSLGCCTGHVCFDFRENETRPRETTIAMVTRSHDIPGQGHRGQTHNKVKVKLIIFILVPILSARSDCGATSTAVSSWGGHQGKCVATGLWTKSEVPRSRPRVSSWGGRQEWLWRHRRPNTGGEVKADRKPGVNECKGQRSNLIRSTPTHN